MPANSSKCQRVLIHDAATSKLGLQYFLLAVLLHPQARSQWRTSAAEDLDTLKDCGYVGNEAGHLAGPVFACKRKPLQRQVHLVTGDGSALRP